MAVEKIRWKVKHSSSGPLFAGKGIRDLSQNGWFQWAPDRFGHTGPKLFSALRYPSNFRIMQRNYAWKPSHKKWLKRQQLEVSYGQKRIWSFFRVLLLFVKVTQINTKNRFFI